MYVGDLSRVSSPTHVARDHTSVTKDLFYYRNMPQTIGALYPWLKINNGSNAWLGRDLPAKLVGTRCPFPGIGLCSPWHIHSVQLIVALIGPPCTGWIREPVGSSARRLRRRRISM